MGIFASWCALSYVKKYLGLELFFGGFLTTSSHFYFHSGVLSKLYQSKMTKGISFKVPFLTLWEILGYANEFLKILSSRSEIFICPALGCGGEERVFLSNHTLVCVNLRGWGVLRRWEKSHPFFCVILVNASNNFSHKVVVIVYVTAPRYFYPTPLLSSLP